MSLITKSRTKALLSGKLTVVGSKSGTRIWLLSTAWNKSISMVACILKPDLWKVSTST